MLKIISKLNITVLVFILFSIIISMISCNTSCDNKFSNLLGSSSIGGGSGGSGGGGGGSGGNITGKVSNTFGAPLSRDIDNDGDNDAAAVFNNIAGGNGSDSGISLYVDSSGKVYVTGYSWNGSNDDMYVIRLNSDGSMDNTFGTNGMVVVNNIAGGNGGDSGYSIYVDSNGKVYVTGASYNGSNDDIYVIQIE